MRGRYQVDGLVEDFSCGSGPAGWRCTATRDDGDRLDLTVDRSGRTVRILADFDGWTIRGGSAGEQVFWTRDETEQVATAAGFTGSSPVYDVAVARLLGLAVGESTRVTLVELTEPVGAARTVEHAWARTASPESEVDRYEVADLATAERWVVHLAGEVLVAREGSRPAHLTQLAL